MSSGGRVDLKKKKIIYLKLHVLLCAHVECFIFAVLHAFIIFTVDLSRGHFSPPPPDH